MVKFESYSPASGGLEMFGSTHYLPILRWKRGEYIALRELFNEDRQRMTPLVELVPRSKSWRGEALEARAQDFIAEINRSWGEAPLLVDPQHLASEAAPAEVITEVLTQAAAEGLTLLPVVDFSRSDEYYSAIRDALSESDSVGLRLLSGDLYRKDLSTLLASLLDALTLTRQRVYLIFDFAYLPHSADLYPSPSDLVAKIPGWNDWGAIVLLSGSFPLDLSEFRPGQHIYTRADWRAWKRLFRGMARRRAPAYGDYATLHPLYFPPSRGANPSASIRYTAHEHWVVMRGEGIRTPDGPGHAQWPANAQLLCDRVEFCGADFSYGDAYISEMAQQLKRTGNPETWLTAAVNHHLTFVVRQIANLGGAEGSGGR